MKYLSLIISLLVFALPAQAKKTSACHYSCFEQKYHCNIKKSYTFNDCDDALLECKMSCEDTETKNFHTAKFPFDISS